MQRLNAIVAALLVGTAQAAAAQMPEVRARATGAGAVDDQVMAALRAQYEREFVVAGCQGAGDACIRKALALPASLPDDPAAVCLKSVLPDVQYQTDGKTGYGVEFKVTATSAATTSSAYRFRQKYPAILMARNAELADFCFSGSVDVGGMPVRIRIADDARPSSSGQQVTAGILAGIIGRASNRTIDRIRALPGEAVAALLGDSSTGVVRVSIVSAQPGQVVKVEGRSLGQTTIEKIGMPKLSLKKLQIGKAKLASVLDTCRAFTSGNEYLFSC